MNDAVKPPGFAIAKNFAKYPCQFRFEVTLWITLVVVPLDQERICRKCRVFEYCIEQRRLVLEMPIDSASRYASRTCNVRQRCASKSSAQKRLRGRIK
jgi:hypothetical protein